MEIVSLSPQDDELHVGQRLVIRALEGSVEVEIRCYVNHPPPPKYRECSACGKFTINQAQAHSFHVPEFDEPWNGLLYVYATASGGETVEIRRPVVPEPSVTYIDGLKKKYEFLDKRFAETNALLSTHITSLARETRVRSIAARALTVAIGAGGLAIAGGIGGWLTQAIGITVALGALAERVLSNQVRLLARSEAHHALTALRRAAIEEHTRRLASIISQKDSPNLILKKEALQQAIEMIQALNAQLSQGLDAVLKYLDRMDEDELRRLAAQFDREVAGTQRRLPSASLEDEGRS